MSDAKQIPILNPSDVSMRPRWRPFRMWAGACAPTEIYVWADGVESAFAALVEYLDDNAPGCLVSHEKFRELCDETARERGFEDFDSAIQHFGGLPEAWENKAFRALVEHAERDLTTIGHTSLTTGSHIPSHEWGGDEISGDEYVEVHVRSLEEDEAAHTNTKSRR